MYAIDRQAASLTDPTWTERPYIFRCRPDGLVQDADFNAEICVRFLHNSGIEANVDDTTGGFCYPGAEG